ncbi:MAG: AAA family ATPase, partial [Pseudomonadota bacterium]
MQFTKLRLEGFKSFVDPTELRIEAGLTGVVGPNGCGKSNLLEALRWVMGESRAKAMRGGGMEDVIFAGCEARPARARASVDLVIEDIAGTAPGRWADEGLIEITRRIQRDTGSDYRINGKSVRARDVQILFADAATGAASPALVRQGQIAEIINSKPQKRRRILEDAAGISGLYQRRHESLLKLKAAETNLERLDDVLEQLSKSHAALEKQVGAARRYRDIAAALREAEARLLRMRLRLARAAREAAEAAQAEGLVALGQAERAAREAEAAREVAEAAIPPARDEEAVATAVLQRLTHEITALDERARQATARIEGLQRERARAAEDRAREADLDRDAATALERLDAEQTRLERAGAGADERLAEAKGRAAEAEAQRAAAEEAADQAAAALAAAQADAESARRAATDAARAIEKAEAEEARLADALAAAQGAETRATADATETAEQRETAIAEAHRAAVAKATAAEVLAAAEEVVQGARGRLGAAESALATLDAEKRSLERLLESDRGATDRVLDALAVAPGFEAALGAALGDDLEAPAVAEGSGWHLLAPLAAASDVPAEPLASQVDGPAALTRRLSRVWVCDGADGPTLQATLPVGGRLVSRDGDLWRWDGFVRLAADAPSAAAQRLKQVNRLKLLAAEHSAATAARDDARAAQEDAQTKRDQAAAEDRAARERAETAEGDADRAGRDAARAAAALAEVETKCASLTEAVTAHAGALAELREAGAAAHAAAAAVNDPDEARHALEAARTAAVKARAGAHEASARASDEERAVRGRERRLRDLDAERRAWQGRAAEARGRM